MINPAGEISPSGSNQPSRMCVRMLRAYAYGETSINTGLMVALILIFDCNRVPHLLMRLLALEYVRVFAIDR